MFCGITALGDDRRYFSYYKALSVLEKVPFKITSVDQIKGLPAIGKSLRDSVSTSWIRIFQLVFTFLLFFQPKCFTTEDV